MNKFLKPAALVVINALVGFGYTANTFAQEETETQPRESRLQQKDRYFPSGDLRLNSEFSEYLQWPFGWNQRPEFSELTPWRQDSEQTHDQYPQYLLPTQDEQRLRTVRTEKSLRTEEGHRPQQRETDQGQAFGEGIVTQTGQRQQTGEGIVLQTEQRQQTGEEIVLQTEQRRQAREVIVEPRQTRRELVIGNADSETEYLQQEQTEHFVAPPENSSLVRGGTIVQQENVRQIQVIEGHQIDGQRVVEDRQLIEGQRLVDGQPQIQRQPTIEGTQVVEGQLPVQGQRVFESTEQIQQRPRLERQVVRQRVETQVLPPTEETRREGIASQTSRREIETLETENLVGVSPKYTPNRFEKEAGQAAVVAPMQNQRGQQAQGEVAQRAIAPATTRRSQRESQKAGAWWMFLPLVPVFCWAAMRFVGPMRREKHVSKTTRSTTDQSTTRSGTARSESREDRTVRSEADPTERKSRDRSEETVRSETRPEREDRTVRSEADRTERKSRDRSEETVRSETRTERPEREDRTVRSEAVPTERKSRDRSEETVRSDARPEREDRTVRSEADQTERKSRDRSEATVQSETHTEREDRTELKSRDRSEQTVRSEARAEREDRTVRSKADQTERKSRDRSEQTVRSEARTEREDRTNRETVASAAEGRDDLTRIEGITEEAQQALYSSGYYRFSDLQNANKKQLKRVLADSNLKFTAAQTKSWIVQSGSLISQGESSERSVQQSQLQFNTSDSETRGSEERASRNASSQRDDLTKIRGIGKATSNLLSRSGITSYRDLYEVEPQRLRQLLDQAGRKFKLIDPSSWSRQAELAMSADWDGLERWQSESAGASSTQVDRDYSSLDPDDLTAIRGIGPATQKLLGEKGIRRFEQIASMKSEQFEELFAEHQERFNLVDPSTWPEQAQSMLRNRAGYNDQENEILNEIQSIAELAKEQPRETRETRQSDYTPQS